MRIAITEGDAAPDYAHLPDGSAWAAAPQHAAYLPDGEEERHDGEHRRDAARQHPVGEQLDAQVLHALLQAAPCLGLQQEINMGKR